MGGGSRGRGALLLPAVTWALALGCGAPAPTVLAEGEVLPRGVAVDGTFVYWSSTDTARAVGAIRRVARRGGRPTTLYRARGATPGAVAVHGGFVYWTELGPHGDDGRVLKVPARGGAATVLAAGQRGPRSVAVDGTAVFWTNRGAGERGGAVMALDAGGGAPVALAPSRSNPWGLAVDGGAVYWTEVTLRTGAEPTTEGRVMKVDRQGGAPVELARRRAWPQELAVDGAWVYWTEQRGAHADHATRAVQGAVMRVAKGGGVAHALARVPELPGPIALGPERVYWLQQRLHARDAAGSCYTLSSVAKRGGEPRVLVTEERTLGALAVDAAEVVWTDLGVVRPFSRPDFRGAIHRLRE